MDRHEAIRRAREIIANPSQAEMTEHLNALEQFDALFSEHLANIPGAGWSITVQGRDVWISNTGYSGGSLPKTLKDAIRAAIDAAQKEPRLACIQPDARGIPECQGRTPGNPHKF